MRISKKRDFECWVSKKYLFLNGFFFLLFFSTSFIIGTNALAANRATGTWYYCQLSQGGNDGSSCDNCLSMAQFAADTFSAPNTAVFCNNGGNITSQVTLPSSGTAGNIITYRGDATNPPTFTSAAQTAHMNCRSYVTLGPNITMSGTGYGVNATCYAASPTDQTITGVTITSGTFPILADVAAAGTLNNFTVSNVVASGQTQSMQLGGGATGRGTLTFTNNNIDASSIAAGYAVQLRYLTGMTASGNVITNTQAGLTAGVYLLDIAGTWNYTFPTSAVGIAGSSVTGLYVDSVLGTGTISGTLGQTSVSGTQSAVFISNSSPTSLTVSNMTVDGATKTGGAAFTAQCSGVGTTQNVNFNGNTAKNGLSSTTIDGFMVNSSAAGCTVQNITFTGNTAEGNGCDGFSGYATGITDNITYTNNIARNNGTNESNSNCGDGFTFHNTCSNIKMNYNLVYGNRVSGFAHVGTSNGTMYNNTIYNNGGDKNSDGVAWGTRGARGCLYLDLTAAAANSWKFKNNICAQNAPWEIKVDADGWSSLDINNNDYIHNESWATEAKFATLDSGVSDLTKAQYLVSEGGSYEASSKYSDPLFRSLYDFVLRPSSSAVDLGINVYLINDYLGNSMYGLPDAGAYEYRPVYTFGAYSIPTTGSVRLYSDGKYRMVTASSSAAIADFSVTPVGGSFYATTTQYMDISIDTWQTTGDKNKAWTVTSTAGSFKTHATSTVYTIGDLLSDTYYTFRLDGSASSTAITGSNCSGSVCLSDGTGNIAFTYAGGYSTHTFELDNATTCTFESHGTNDWNTASNWSCAMVPTSTTIVIIPSSTTTRLSVDSEAGNVTIGSGSTLDLNNRTLNITNDWTDNGTLTPGTGSVVFNGDGAQSIGAEANFYNLTIQKASGTAILTGNVTSTNDVVISSTGYAGLTIGANTLHIGGDLTKTSGTVTTTDSTVDFNGSGVQTCSSQAFTNISVRKTSGVLFFLGNITILGTLVTSGGGTLNTQDNSLSVTGASTIGSGTTVTSTSGAKAFAAVTNSGSLGSSSGIITMTSLTNSGTLSTGSTATSTGAVNNSGTIKQNGETFNVKGDWTDTGTLIPGGGTVRFNGTGLTINEEGNFYNLTIGQGNATLGGNVTSTGTFAVNSGATLAVGAKRFAASSTYTNNGTVSITTGQIVHDYDSTLFTDNTGTEVSTMTNPGIVYVTIIDKARNLLGTTAETLTLTVSHDAAAGADSETMTLTETGAATGVFRNTTYLPFVSSASIVHNDGQFEINAGGLSSMSYTSPYNLAETGTDTMLLTLTGTTPGGSSGSGGGGGSGSLPTITKYQTSTSDPDRLKNLANLVLEGISINTLVKLPDDGNVNTQEDSAVYYIGSDGRRHAFPNSRVFFTWYADFSGVQVITPAQMASVPLGKNVIYKPGVKMIKFITLPDSYVVTSGGILRWVKTEAVAKTYYGTNWNQQIDDINDTFFSNYKIGDPIDSSTDLDLVEVKASVSSISDALGL